MHLNKLKGGEDIDYTRIRNIVANNESISELHHLDLTAFHEETGLVIKSSHENIKTGERECSRIRNIVVKNRLVIQ